MDHWPGNTVLRLGMQPLCASSSQAISPLSCVAPMLQSFPAVFHTPVPRQADPALLASGSDDCTVKLWSTKSPSSVAQVGAGQMSHINPWSSRAAAYY